MQKIYLLTDYKERFGSKYDAKPYRSGMNKKIISKIFASGEYEACFINFSKAQKMTNVANTPILYTSVEDIGYHYKSYIEDVVLHLETLGANIIPRYEFLRANNNKSFMEIFRKKFESSTINSIKSWSIGAFEELQNHMDDFRFPVVVKESAGAMSKGVYLANDKKELIKVAKKVSRMRYYFEEIKDYLRSFKYDDYSRDSRFRSKYIIQQYLPDLKNDWKVLIYFDKVFVLERGVRKGDFRASGSKFNYLAGSKTKLPDGFLDFVFTVRKEFDVPNISLDIVYDGNEFHVIEFQAIHFGTSTYNMSDIYYEKTLDSWVQKKNDATIEEYYCESVISYLEKS